jgi:hypothetical protein
MSGATAEADNLTIAWGRYSYVSASYRKRQVGAPA